MDWPQTFRAEAPVCVVDDLIDSVSRAVFIPLGADQPRVSFGFVEWHEPRLAGRRELCAALALEFSQALVLVAGLDCDSIVEAVEFVGEISERFAGLFQFGS